VLIFDRVIRKIKKVKVFLGHSVEEKKKTYVVYMYICETNRCRL